MDLYFLPADAGSLAHLTTFTTPMGTHTCVFWDNAVSGRIGSGKYTPHARCH